MRRALPLLVLALLVVAGGGAGAATVKTVEPGPVRAEIARQVTATYPGLVFGNVACPDGVPLRRGGTFTCTVQLPGNFLLVDATQTDRTGGVTFETAQAVFTRQSLEAFVTANASLPTTVTCGTTDWLVARPGQVLTCHGSSADGSQHDIQVTVRDTAGDVTITGVT